MAHSTTTWGCILRPLVPHRDRVPLTLGHEQRSHPDRHEGRRDERRENRRENRREDRCENRREDRRGDRRGTGSHAKMQRQRMQ